MEKCFHPVWPDDSRYHEPNRGPFPFPWPSPYPLASTSFHDHRINPFSSSIAADGIAEDRATAASKSHSQAEKRRRERINAHLSSLRKLIPRSDKMDKATLLGSVIDRVKDLKRKAVEISQAYTVPSEVDEVTIDCDPNLDPTNNNNNSNNNKENIFIKVTVCCDDRPGLFTDLIQAIKGLNLTTVRAEMATLGGRVINVLILSAKEYDENMCLSSLKQTLKVVLSRLVSTPTGSVNGRSSKRQRIFPPLSSSQSHIDSCELPHV